MKKLIFSTILIISSLNLYGQCDIPVFLNNISTVQGGLNQIDLSWSNAAGALNYAVYYRVAGSMDAYSAKMTSINSATIKGLPATTTYEWKVKTICAADWSVTSDFSALEQFTTLTGGTCDAPANLNSISTGSGSSINSTDISWDAVGAAVFYSVAYRVQGTTPFTYKTLNTNSLTLDGLPASTTYEWKVRTICASDWSSVSAFSAIETFVTGTGIECIAPAGVSVTNVTSTSFTMNWTSVNSAIQYYIQYRVPGEQEWETADYVFTYRTSDKTINGLVADKVYEARMLAICAVDGGGKWTSFSPYSSVVSFDTYECLVPTNLNSIPADNTAELSWDVVSGALFYQIKYKESATPTYTFNIQTNNGSENSIIITGLDPNKSYDWIVRTRCDVANTGFNSAYTTPRTFVTLDGDECLIPVNMLSSPGSFNATLQWDVVPAALSYTVKWKEQGETTYLNSANTGGAINTLTISGLKSETNYDWIVRSNCSGDGTYNSEYSLQSFTTIAGESCHIPTNLGESNLATTSVTLFWDDEPYVDQYRLKIKRSVDAVYYTTYFPVTNSLNLTGLDPNTSYDWVIRTECGFANSQYSIVKSFSTLSSREPDASSSLRIGSDTEGMDYISKKYVHAAQLESSDIDQMANFKFQWKVYPNPSNGIINIDININTEGSYTIRAMSVEGQLKEQFVITESNTNLDLSHFDAGVYVLQLISNYGNTEFKRIVIQ